MDTSAILKEAVRQAAERAHLFTEDPGEPRVTRTRVGVCQCRGCQRVARKRKVRLGVPIIRERIVDRNRYTTARLKKIRARKLNARGERQR